MSENTTLNSRLKSLEERVKRIEDWCKKLREHPLSLRERFLIHDQMMRFKSQFEALEGSLPEDLREELKELVEGLCILVDRALGVKW